MGKAPPERIDPLSESVGIVAYHEVKYRFADDALPTGVLLDVGCGVGYGTALLARRDRFVIGMDVAADALAVAGERYQRNDASFARMSGDRLGIASSSIDGVVCLEAIEHFEHPESHIAEVARVLKPHGTYVVSTPRPGTGASPDENHFHLHEFDASQLERLLRAKFSEVVVLGQRREHPARYHALRRIDRFRLRGLRPVRPLVRRIGLAIGVTATEDATLDEFVIDELGATAGTELLAVCRGPRP